MGGWLALLLLKALGAEASPHRRLVLIAPAVDMTEALIWETFTEAAREAVLKEGVWLRPSAYGAEPYPITRALIEDGRRHLMLGAPVAVDCPVRILQGDQDIDVPPAHAMAGIRVSIRQRRGRSPSSKAATTACRARKTSRSSRQR